MKNWKYIDGAEVGNEAKVNPVDPSPKTGSKPNPDNNQNPKKNPKKEMTDKNGRTFREVLEEVKKTSNSTEKLFYGLSKDAEKEEEKSDKALDELKKTGKVLNSKVGNSTVSEYNSEIQRLTRKAEQLRRMGQGKQAMEVEKQIEKLGKELAEIGNSASDDKFAYVMREFEEGKLKTPDGKVVTDPAQAKAIAYSESKKTENGLARARNAMAKNSATYKDFLQDLKNAIRLDVAGINYNNVDEQTLKQWVEQAKKEGYASAIKGLQGKKLILDVY